MNGYCELHILGKKRGVKFGNYAFERLGGLGAFVDKVGEGYYGFKFLVDIVYAGLVNNCMRKDELPDFNYEDIYDFIEEHQADAALGKELEAVVKAFETSKPIQDKIGEVKEEAKKKTGKKSS